VRGEKNSFTHKVVLEKSVWEKKTKHALKRQHEFHSAYAAVTAAATALSLSLPASAHRILAAALLQSVSCCSLVWCGV